MSARIHGRGGTGQRRLRRGFGLVEMLVTIAIMAWLAATAIPTLLNSMYSARARALVQRFAQDFSWARGQAVTGAHVFSITFNSDCSWSLTQDGTLDSNHSSTSAQVAAAAPGVSCSSSGTFPLSFAFTSQGFLSGSTSAVTLTFTARNGQTWPLQTLLSGALIRSSGAS